MDTTIELDQIPKTPIYNHGDNKAVNGYVQDLSSLARSANRSEYHRVHFCTALAAITRGKDASNSPSKRYKTLLKEASYNRMCNGNIYTLKESGDIIYNDRDISELAIRKMRDTGTASRPLEFIPVKIKVKLMKDDSVTIYLNNKEITCSLEHYLNNIGKFGYYHDGVLRTNLRALYNAGIPYEDIPYNDICKEFYVYKLQVPMFVFNHLITHTMISKETRSERYVDITDVPYWLPEDILKRVSNFTIGDTPNDAAWCIDELQTMLTKNSVDYILLIQYLLSLSAYDAQEFFKALGYKKEIYQRAMLEFRYKETVMGAWNEDKTWGNLFRERGADPYWKSGVQKPTEQAVKVIRSMMYKEK